MILKRVVILFISLISLNGNIMAQSTPVQNIPDFTFYKMNGQAFSRKDLTKDKKIVIVFFDITCEHCQQEIKTLSKNFYKFKKAEFYLVSLDEVSGIQSFVKKYAPEMNAKPNVTLLRDFNREFIIKFLPVQYPALYVFRPDGHLIKYFGQNSKVADILTAVNKK